jgi:hypothetical protein
LDGLTNLQIWTRGKSIIDRAYKVSENGVLVDVSIQGAAKMTNKRKASPLYEALNGTERKKLLKAVRKAEKETDPSEVAQWDLVLKLLCQFLYLQATIGCILSGETGKLMQRLWKQCTGGPWCGDTCQNKHDSMLMILGVKGCGTPFHLDWSNAVNVAFALSAGTMHTTLALWSFLHPSELSDKKLKGFFDEWCLKNLQKYCLEGEDTTDLRLFNQEVNKTPSKQQSRKPLLSMTDMAEFNTFLASKSERPDFQFTIHVHQKHGEVMQVCVGWSHQVVNMEECMKYAFDFATTSNAMQCVHTNNVLHAMYAGVNAPEYRSILEEGADWTKKCM